ncbi:hypothetical protein FZEAL_3364 [Fusarium zealandicum]|uniref:Zn(2)-C6 fungal-type domain-containing protein n=1 Tax=Fusarium zealandicum TaxID=1053134 RepID=A0A8H4XLW5_9HYPO|nr:hypothetical protein FZEAL_3364 [Fusarium zealandicum]
MSGSGFSGPDQLNRLSCTRCKERKVRCNRVMPRCSRCSAQDLECIFPVRAKRKTTRPPVDPALSTASSAALSTILDRLQRLEAQSVGPSTSAISPSTPSQFADDASPSACSPAASSTLNGRDSCAVTPHQPRHEIDAMTILKDAVDRVQELRLRSFGSAMVTNPINIPPDLAKTWVQNYFAHMPACMFLGLVDRRVIELMPDIIDLPHIHIDPVILVMYYSILYHGCSLKASNISSVNSHKYMNASYLGALRAIPSWEREASGSIEDLISALLMTRVAAEFFDYDLAWKMFKYACEYCQALNLHNLDDDTNCLSVCDDDKCDNERRGFWEVIQIDLFFRLVINTPPAITNNPWKVNLPWLDAGSEPPPHGIQSTAFLASSRVSLVIARFFAMLDDPQNTTKAEIMTKTEGLGREMQQIYAEWQLNEWMADAPDNERDVWLVADVLFTGYTSIIYMFRKMALLDSNSPKPPITDLDIPDSPIVEDAARHIINLLNRLLTMYPFVETMTCLFGAYRCFVAYAYLANTVLHAEDARVYMEDVKSLERLGNQTAFLARGQKDIVPLVRALQLINDEIRRKLERGP